MNPPPSQQSLPAAQRVTQKALDAFERFFQVESVSGIVLLLAAAAALVWANSQWAPLYQHLQHAPLTIALGEWSYSTTLHFVINDGLMTVFFLIVGMEIRREMHDGALADLKQAALPVGAAMGGVAVPALLYLALNGQATRHGWAVPTATDIAFAVGVLALLGKGLPSSVRIFLLTLAIIDDIVAVLIIAFFYSDGIDPFGFVLAVPGILLALGLQRAGFGSAYAYVLPGAVVWAGLLIAGIHPTLAGVILGLMTPVVATQEVPQTVDTAVRAISELAERAATKSPDTHELAQPVRHLKYAQRELLPPVVRVQMALHPWVAFLIMPLFALANAGVNLGQIDLRNADASMIVTSVAIALVIGKPIGVLLSSWLLVRLGWCRLPGGMSWSWMGLVGSLAGIGFTMSIFIANLAFQTDAQLSAAKLGVLLASVVAGVLGLVLGWILMRRVSQ
jgi:NhaA family Na+:H+ antiporter